jgi:ribosomal protein L11 methyltransferase
VVILDPGLSFGTGQHPTTAFCLDQIVACLKPEQPVSLLDIGTGSGILAIAAAKLGYSRVDAIDIDVNSVRVARGNALRNGVTRRIRFLHSDLACLPVAGSLKYDVVCANLLAHLIVDQSARITRRVAAGGRLVLAGILENEFSRVRAACEEAGLSLLASKGARGWRSGVFAGQSAREARRKRAAIRDLA